MFVNYVHYNSALDCAIVPLSGDSYSLELFQEHPEVRKRVVFFFQDRAELSLFIVKVQNQMIKFAYESAQLDKAEEDEGDDE